MKSVICTLFEGHYHFGLAALINSLHEQGFAGDLYAGFRGELPPWATGAVANPAIPWKNTSTLSVDDKILVHFIPLETDYHFTNYKPDFMLELVNGHAKGAGGIFYFDPDIVLTAPWSFMEEWGRCGVALSEDIHSPLDKFHPKRIAWRQFFSKSGVTLEYKSNIYVNGGFAGVTKENYSFLYDWKKIQELMAPAIGGLNRSIFVEMLDSAAGPLAPFAKTDQDALNATVEACNVTVSLMGQEGMAFKVGNTIMPHAIGIPKPWNWKPLTQIMHGFAPRVVDKEYWRLVQSPIAVYPAAKIKRVNLFLKIAAFIGRFYRRS